MGCRKFEKFRKIKFNKKLNLEINFQFFLRCYLVVVPPKIRPLCCDDLLFTIDLFSWLITSCFTLIRHISQIIPVSLLFESRIWIHKSYNKISNRNSNFRLASAVWRHSSCIVTWQYNRAFFFLIESCQRQAGFFFYSMFSFGEWSRNMGF